jgi:hypothetical protein
MIPETGSGAAGRSLYLACLSGLDAWAMGWLLYAHLVCLVPARATVLVVRMLPVLLLAARHCAEVVPAQLSCRGLGLLLRFKLNLQRNTWRNGPPLEYCTTSATV